MKVVMSGSSPLNLKDYADIANVVIAAMALCVGMFSIWFSRKALQHQENHNKLSVQPIPVISFANYEDLIRIKVCNNGTGPLIIKSIKVSDGKFTSPDVISLMPILNDGDCWSSYTSIFADRAILPGNEIILIEYKCDVFDSSQTVFREKCRKRLSELYIEVEYSDIYHQVYPLCKRSGIWFLQKITINHSQLKASGS